MISIKRKKDQAIIVRLPDGRQMRIIPDRKCRLTFDAHPDFSIVRQEVADRYPNLDPPAEETA